jgi:precorrin-6B methylase 2
MNKGLAVAQASAAEKDPLCYIYSIYYGNRKAAALTVAVRHGIFDFIAVHEPKGVPVADIIKEYKFSDRGTEALLLALEFLNLLERKGDRYILTPLSRQYLTSTATDSIRGLIDLEYEEFITPSTLDAALRSGRSQVYAATPDVWQHHEVDQERCVRFTAAMHAISAGPARAFVETLRQESNWGLPTSLATSPHHVLDVGGGSGCYALEWMRHAPVPNSIVDILETPSCAKVTEQYVAAARAAVTPNVVRVLSGDMFCEESYGEAASYTHVLLSQILHDWPLDTTPTGDAGRSGKRLLALAWRALRPGGVLVVHEKLIHDADTAMVALDMLHWTTGQQFTEEMMRDLLESTGFVALRFRKTGHTYWWAVLAQRPLDTES